MPRALIRVLVTAGFGAMTGALLLILWYPASRDVVLEMDREAPSFLSGTYAVERDGPRTFAWTSSRVVLRLAGLDRRTAWTCTLHMRGAREASVPQPVVTLSVDSAGAVATTLSNDYVDVTIDVPPRPDRPGLTLSADVAPTFSPGASDPRDLGAQLDWLRCTNADGAWPPAAALRAAAVGAGALAAATAVTSAPSLLIVGVVLLVSAGQASLLVSGGGSFGAYPELLTTLVVGAAVLLALLVWAPSVLGRARLSGSALVAVTASVVLALLKLAALVHPAKPLIDAVFQAHRLEWVLAGRYFFTQPLPDGVQFPYAIGLYVTAAPLASLITDHVLLLRLVVIGVEAVAGMMVYAVVARGLHDRAAGVVAALLFHVVPLPYVVVGNANLTNAFAQAMGTITLCALALMPAPARSVRFVTAAAGVGLLTAVSFLSHVSTIVLLAGILGMSVVVFVGARRRELTQIAGYVVVMTTLAGLLSVGLYYRHFVEVYTEALSRVRAPAAAAVAPPDSSEGRPAVLVRPLAWHERASASAGQTRADLGWPLLLLGAVGGVWGLRSRRDRVALLLMAWGGAWGLFLVGGTLTRVDVEFQRYAAEFVARVNLAAYPVVVMMAALGVTVLWRWGKVGRVVSVAGVIAAVTMGLVTWLRWLS